MKAVVVSALFATSLVCAFDAGASPPYGSPKRLDAPVLFGEGVLSTQDFESHPAFTPDGATLYFVKSTPTFSFWTIMVSRFARGRWSTPEVAPFSGQYSDADPFVTRDGGHLYFISNRPAPGKTARDLDVWRMDREGAGWSEPHRLEDTINSAGNEWFPTLASDGTLYFGSDRPGGLGATDLYRSRFVDGAYAPAENLGSVVNTAFDEYEPWIAPDQSWLLFMAAGRPDSHGGSNDLYVTTAKDGAWTTPRNLGDAINSPRDEYSPTVSPDGRYLFFASTRGSGAPKKRVTYAEWLAWARGTMNGLGNLWQVELEAVLGKK